MSCMFQGLLPLAILAVPLSLIFAATLLQLSLDLATLVFTGFLWAVPCVQVNKLCGLLFIYLEDVQAAVQLRFIRKSTAKSPEGTRIHSLSRPSAR